MINKLNKNRTAVNWELVPLKDLGKWSGGGTPSKAKPEYWEKGMIPWVSPKDMKTEKIHDSEDHITEIAVKESTASLVPEGSILIVTRSGILRHTLPIAIASLPVTINQDLKALTPAKGLLTEYIAWALRTFSQDILHSCSKQGTTVNSIETNKLLSFNIPIAPLVQQKRIVAEIEKQFSRLDQAVQNLKRVKANLKRYKAAVLKAAVEGKLTEQWRKEHPKVEPADKLLQRILAERRKRWEENELAKMKAKGKAPKDDKWKSRCKESDPLETSTLPKLPDKWIWARIEDVGQIQLGRQRAPKYHQGANMKPYLRVQNIFEDRIDLEDVMEMDFPPNDFKNYKLEPGDILLNEGQSPELLGRPALYRGELPNACFTNTLIRFQVHPPMEPYFSLLVFRAYMRSRRFMKESTITTNIAHLSVGRFAKIEYPLPPLEEQAEIVKESQKYLSIIDALNKEAERALKRADRLRQAILKKAFTGQLISSAPDFQFDANLESPMAAES